MTEHASGGLGAFAIAQPGIEPPTQQQQPARRQPADGGTPSPALAPCQIEPHAAEHQHQPITGPQHHQQQGQPQARALRPFGPEGPGEGGHHPRFRVHIEQQSVEDDGLQPPQSACQPAALSGEASLLRQPPDRDGRETQGQGLGRQQPLHRWDQLVEQTGAVQQPGTVIRQHVNVLHRGDRWQPLADQPDPLVKQAEVVGVAVQQGMPQGAAAPADQPQTDGKTPELAGWFHSHVHSCHSPGTGSGLGRQPGIGLLLTSQ